MIAQTIGVILVDGGVGNDDCMVGLGALTQELGESGQIAAADLDIVAPLSEVDADVIDLARHEVS